MNRNALFFLLCVVISIQHSTAQVFYPGDNPGKAMIKTLSTSLITLENNVIGMVIENNSEKIVIKNFVDKKTHEQLNLGSAPLFKLTLKDGRVFTSNQFALESLPGTSVINGDKQATTDARKFAGKKYEADFANKKLGIKIHWEVELRDSSNYIRQAFSFTAKDSVKVNKISLVNLPSKIIVKKKRYSGWLAHGT